MGSGGGSGGSGVDKEYNARMAAIAEQQQGMANEMYEYWKSGPGHWEVQSAGSIPGLTLPGLSGSTGGDGLWGGLSEIASLITPQATEKKWVKDPGGVSYVDMEQAQMKSNMELIPKQTAYQSATIDAEMGLIPKRSGLESAMIDEQTTNIGLRKPVTAKYFDEVIKGVNVDERMDLARADVEQAYSGAEGNARRWASGMGINPASKKYGAGLMSLSREKAAAKVGAASLARRQAEEENFSRLSGAMGLKSA